PVITLEILEDGTPSWQTEQLAPKEESSDAQPQSAATSSEAAPAVSLDKLLIKNGSLTFVDHAKKARHEVTSINTSLKADSLKGPFSGNGALVYEGKEIVFDVNAGDISKEKAVPVRAEIKLPQSASSIAFDGVSALSMPLDVQGKVNIETASLQGMVAQFSPAASAPGKKFSLETFLTATEAKADFDELKVVLGGFNGNGKISIQNLQSQNPLLLKGSIKSSSVLDLNDFQSSEKVEGESGAKLSSTESGTQAKEIVPSTLTLAMPIDVDFQLDVGGIKTADMLLKGTFVDLNKTGKSIKASFKVLEIPGQAKASGNLDIAYKSSSSSPKGEVILADPSVSYQVNGQIGQLAEFLNKIAPSADTKKVTDLYKTVQFDLDGSINGQKIALKDSTLKLDDTIVGLKGSYQPATSSERAKAVIDVSAGDIDIDRITGNNTKKSSAESAAKAPLTKKEITKPLENLSIPMDIDFDISMQKAIVSGYNLQGVRLDGALVGNALTLETASVQDFAGAAVSAKGSVANIKSLSGLDLTGYMKTEKLQDFAKALNIDISQLPQGLNALEASVTGKGELENLSFSSNVKALNGQVDAAGLVKDALGAKELSDLSVRLQHPSLLQALQIVQPDFAGTDSLNQAVNFYSKVNSAGKVYKLSSMTLTLGPNNISGNVDIDLSNKVTGISGTIRGKQIALDNLLGEKKARAQSGGGSGQSSSGGKWSSEPFSLDWMNTMNVDVNVEAEQLTYGKWNFLNPKTNLKIANGKMNVDQLTAGVFGGNATVSAKATNNPVVLELDTKMEGINLESLAGALSGSERLKASGTVSFAADVKGAGESPKALIAGLNGDASLVGGNVVIKGFDLAKLANGLRTDEKLITSLQSFADGALSSGETRFDTINGDYNIKAGIVKIEKMVMDGPSSVINSTGQADLNQWFINVDNFITLKGVEDLEPIEVKIKGPIDNPTDTFGKNILEDYIQQKVQRKLGKELPGILGDDATNALQQFGILPKQQAPTPAPVEEAAPANDNQTVQQNAAPVEEQPAQEEPQKIEKPEDAVEQLLNSDSAEDAVDNLIKGLF
ncbi:MAG: AsmA-like C-terminal region-containing protein, partial [Pseudomonadota bacterium]